MANPRLQKPLEDYIGYWESLSSRSVTLIQKIADPALRYTGPLHQAHGTEAVEAVVGGLLRDLDRAKIRITDHAWGRDGQTAYLRWTLVFFPQGGRNQWTIQGLSEIVFTLEGKVGSHTDYWDSGSQVLARLPATRWFFKKVRDRIAP